MRFESAIEKVLNKLYLNKLDCTLLGASKGGFAALYIGLKYQYKNIVASAFVNKIGSWMVDYDKSISKQVMGDYNENIIEKYDNLLSNLILKDEDNIKNIYVFLSKSDEFYYKYGQEKLISILNQKYSNFNVFFTESDLAFKHTVVSSYFLHEILSITNLLTKNINLNLPKDDFRGLNLCKIPSCKDKILLRKEEIKKIVPCVKLRKFFIENGILNIDGLFYLRNYDSPSFNNLYKFIQLKSTSSNHIYEYLLGSYLNKELVINLYQDSYFDYSAAPTATLGFNGISIRDIAVGRYEILASVSNDNSKKWIQPDFHKIFDHRYNDDLYDYRIYVQDKKLYLTKLNLISDNIYYPYYFKVEKINCINNIFYIEGIFMIKGIDISNFNDGRYYIVFKNRRNNIQKTIVLGQLRKEGIGENLGNYVGGYRTCYFATMQLKGINLSNFDHSEYDLYISLVYKSEIFTKKIDDFLYISDDLCELNSLLK